MTTTPAWISLGSNLGDRKATLDLAVAALAGTPGVVVSAVSTSHETAPVGGPTGQGAFLNAAARLDTTLGPLELLDALQAIENRAGRLRAIRWGERTLDLDILIYGTRFLDSPRLKLPHPRLAFRRFVLGPLAEIAPDIVDTMTRRTISDLLARLDRSPRLVALEGQPGPIRRAVFRGLVAGLSAIGIEEEEFVSADGSREPSDRRVIADFERKAEALIVDRWGLREPRPVWIVADFFLSRELHRALDANLCVMKNSSGSTRMADYHAAARRIQDAEDRAVGATLAVVTNEAGWKSKPGQSHVPILRPESDDPDAIVAEVLATCRGIERG